MAERPIVRLAGVVGRAAYDRIADWYEHDFRVGDPMGIGPALGELLGEGTGTCLEIGVGTGTNAPDIARLGWTPVGVDLSAQMLGHVRGRLPVVLGDAERLPVRDGSVAAVASVLVHTDMPGYPAVLSEVRRVLRPGGLFVHLGVHPCFCGGFADRGAAEAVVIGPGYLDQHRTTRSFTDQGLRPKVGASHWPLAALLGMIVDAGLTPRRFVETGDRPTPLVFGFAATG